MREIADALGDLVLGALCPGCGVPALGLCRRCRTLLLGLRPTVVARPLPAFPATVAAGEYAGELRRVLLAAKERNALSQLPLLGTLLARSIAMLVLAADPIPPLVLVPVPSVRARVIERGLDLTATLANRAGRQLGGLGVELSVVRAVGLTRSTADQAGLGRSARVVNSRDAYRWRRRVQGSVVLVDDVVTTGATLAAVARAVEQGGGRLLGAVTVAHTAKRGDPKVSAPRG